MIKWIKRWWYFYLPEDKETLKIKLLAGLDPDEAKLSFPEKMALADMSKEELIDLACKGHIARHGV